MARHFFALWPTDEAAGRLSALALAVAAATGGRAVPRGNIHLTLAFLGEIDAGPIACARDIAASLAAESFSLQLETLGAFRRARVAWVTDPAPAPALISLQARLEAKLREAGFVLEERAFNPHVTLARRTESQQAKERTSPINWRATDFALVRSDGGSRRYVSVETWALRG